MQAMAGTYKQFVSGRSNDVVEHVPSYHDLVDRDREVIRRADIVVEQLFDLKQQADTDAISTTTPRIFIPMVTGPSFAVCRVSAPEEHRASVPNWRPIWRRSGRFIP